MSVNYRFYNTSSVMNGDALIKVKEDYIENNTTMVQLYTERVESTIFLTGGGRSDS